MTFPRWFFTVKVLSVLKLKSLTANVVYPWHIVIEAVVQRCSVKMFLEILQNSQGKHMCQGLFLNKVAGLRRANFKKET